MVTRETHSPVELAFEVDLKGGDEIIDEIAQKYDGL